MSFVAFSIFDNIFFYISAFQVSIALNIEAEAIILFRLRVFAGLAISRADGGLSFHWA